MEFIGNVTPWVPIINNNRTYAFVVNTAITIFMFILSVFMLAYNAHEKKGKTFLIPDINLWSSFHPWMTPKRLFVFRVIALIYGLGIQVSYIVWEVEWMNMFEFGMWTQWNFALFICYFCITSALSLAAVLSVPDNNQFKPDTEANGIGKIAMVLFEICFIEAFMIDIVYWSVLVPGYYLVTHTLPLINFWTFNHHGVNLIFMLCEFTFNRIPILLDHVWVVIIWVDLYCIFTIMIVTVAQEWPYPILNAWLPVNIGWYSGFFIGNFLLFGGCYLLYHLKLRCYGKEDWDGDLKEKQITLLEESQTSVNHLNLTNESTQLI